MRDTRTPEDILRGVPPPEVPPMSTRFKVAGILSLLLGLFGAFMFSYQTIQKWNEPKVVASKPTIIVKDYEADAKRILADIKPTKKRTRRIATMGGNDSPPDSAERRAHAERVKKLYKEYAESLVDDVITPEEYGTYGPP